MRRLPYVRALAASTTGRYDFLGSYVRDLPSVLDLDAVRAAGVRIGADPWAARRSRTGAASPRSTVST